MIGFGESFVVWLGSTLIPGVLGTLVVILAGRHVSQRYVVAFGLGIFFWFFVDTIGGSALLDVNSGFGGGAAQVGVVALFLIGVLLFFGIDARRDIFSPQSAVGKYGMMIPTLVAVAVGVHGIGEGAAFGATAYSTSSTSLLEAFGGLNAGVAYVLHKLLEPMMIGACYSFYFRQQGATAGSWLRNGLILSLVFVIPSLLGATTGYFLVYDTTYLFALGTGTAVYVAFRLAGPLFVGTSTVTSKETMRLALSWMLGFMAIYFAALFHS